jgi:hypothetical protein
LSNSPEDLPRRPEPTAQVAEEVRDPLAALHAMAHAHAIAAGLPTAVADALYEQAYGELSALREERDRANRGRAHISEWYAAAHMRLEALGREQGLWPEMAAIIANGTVTSDDPLNYNRMLNAAQFRARAAERRAEAAEQDLARLRADRGLG